MKKEKCSFALGEVGFLGHRIRDGKLIMEGGKIKAIQEWDPPTKGTTTKVFLGPSQLLPSIHQRVFRKSSSTDRPSQER